MTPQEIDRRYAGSRGVAGMLLVAAAGATTFEVLRAFRGPSIDTAMLLANGPSLVPGWFVRLSERVPWGQLVDPSEWHGAVHFSPAPVALLVMVAVAYAWFGAWVRERRADARARFLTRSPLPTLYDRDAGRQLARPRSYARPRVPTRGGRR